MSRKRIWSLKWQTKTKKKKLAIYRAWPWISNCWEWDPNSGLSGFESSALTTRPRRLGANLRRDATSRLLFLNQSVLADFDPRKKKKTTGFKTRSLSGTSNNLKRRHKSLNPGLMLRASIGHAQSSGESRHAKYQAHNSLEMRTIH